MGTIRKCNGTEEFEKNKGFIGDMPIMGAVCLVDDICKDVISLKYGFSNGHGLCYRRIIESYPDSHHMR